MNPRNAPPAPPVPPHPVSPRASAEPEAGREPAPAEAGDLDDGSGESALSTAKFRAIPTPTAAFSIAELDAAAARALEPEPQPSSVREPPPPHAQHSPDLSAQPPATAGFAQSGAFFPVPSNTGAVSALPSSHFATPALAVNEASRSQLLVRPATSSMQAIGIRTDAPRDIRPAHVHVVRSRAYAFALDARGAPIEVGSGRFAKAYLGEERWLESKTDFRRDVVIKVLQKGVTDEDRLRFQIEKELLERVQGHPNIITLYASGESDDPEFIPAVLREKIDNDFVILERLDMSLEERLKGSRARGKRDDLLGCTVKERLFRVLDYMIPVASAVEYAHLIRNICHRDIKPANILVGLPDTSLRGSTLEVRLADFNVAKLHDADVSFSVTQLKSVPGTLFFQSPEQETNVIELLVNVQQGSPEVEFFEDFYIQIEKNDTFALFNRGEQYVILYADRQKKRLVLDRPYKDTTEQNVRAKVQKSVGRAADIYSLGALFYYLISGAYANPKTLYDAFHKFIEYEQVDENNTVAAYLAHEYEVIESLRAPKAAESGVTVAPADRFFTYKQYLDGNGELIDAHIMKIIAKCMIRNKPDSYCQAHDVETRGIQDFVQDLIELYSLYGFHPGAGSTQLARRGHAQVARSRLLRSLGRIGARVSGILRKFLRVFRRRR